MQDRGLAAYIAELVGTFILVFVIGTVFTLFQAPGADSQFGSDYAVIGLVSAFVLFMLMQTLAAVSGAHVNPAVTFAAWLLRRIDGVDSVIYILAQLAGGVLGALLVKGLLDDEGAANDYGALDVSPLLAGDFAGMIVEALGTFFLVLAVVAVALNPRAWRDWAPLAIGATYGFAVMVFAPLTGAGFNPARWLGPALVGDNFGGVWPYLVGPAVGAALAVVFYKFVIEAGEPEGEPEKAPGT